MLALSGANAPDSPFCRFATSSPGRGKSSSGMGPLAWRESFRLKCKVPGRARGSLLEGAGKAVRLCLREFSPLAPSRAFPAAPRFRRKRRCTCHFLHDPSRENGFQESPQTFLKPEIKNILSADYGQSIAAAIPNRPTQKGCCTKPCAAALNILRLQQIRC